MDGTMVRPPVHSERCRLNTTRHASDRLRGVSCFARSQSHSRRTRPSGIVTDGSTDDSPGRVDRDAGSDLLRMPDLEDGRVTEAASVAAGLEADASWSESTSRWWCE